MKYASIIKIDWFEAEIAGKQEKWIDMKKMSLNTAFKNLKLIYHNLWQLFKTVTQWYSISTAIHLILDMSS